MIATTNRRQPATSPLAAKAQRLGLRTIDEAWAEYHAQKEGWSGGKTPRHLLQYECAACGATFASPSGARKHMKTNDHPVLRMDWY